MVCVSVSDITKLAYLFFAAVKMYFNSQIDTF